ncbi:hypothetical protein [Williamsia sp. CHRR-6]|uniref:hypothetical protein n=1 Tax=Williamsia sp. CHRR-6 TaxID=2835871 RepID=UPI001BDB14DC|nr:hypothetical protein [Williamsia sp. CHRR-6]MBT0567582.1 hypothetical protein [Williamsia sp. CHRR-6]
MAPPHRDALRVDLYAEGVSHQGETPVVAAWFAGVTKGSGRCGGAKVAEWVAERVAERERPVSVRRC